MGMTFAVAMILDHAPPSMHDSSFPPTMCDRFYLANNSTELCPSGQPEHLRTVALQVPCSHSSSPGAGNPPHNAICSATSSGCIRNSYAADHLALLLITLP